LMWYVNASFAIHPNMRSHTGGGLTMGRGFPIVMATKQKLNTRSSTESELVGVDDMMPIIVWSRYFLMAQVKKYTHVYLWTRDRTAGVKSFFCAPAGRSKGNVSADVASRTCNSLSTAFSASFRSHNYY
jgi:hypothetical protein